VVLTCGSTDGFSKTIECFTNVFDEENQFPYERQGILCEEFAYMNAIQACAPRGLNVVPVKIDADGMLVEGKGALRDVLENWDASRGKRPHLMYTVT
jgi:DNA-binding transcriptional MocR family regulator